jgi:glutamate-1-semialdehyde 2,1-aminomutase
MFDEVMTSRLGPGGMQGRIGIEPDLTVLGKYIGGGMNFGAVGGRKDLMSRFDPRLPDSLSTAGTFNNNVVTMAAGVAGLERVFTPEAARALNDAGDSLRDALNRLAQEFEVPMQVMGIGSLMNVHFLSGSIRHPEELDRASRPALALFHLEMLARGYHLARRGLIALSLPLTDADLRGFLDAVRDYLETRAVVLRTLVQ